MSLETLLLLVTQPFKYQRNNQKNWKSSCRRHKKNSNKKYGISLARNIIFCTFLWMLLHSMVMMIAVMVPKTNAFMISSSSIVLSFHDHDDHNNYNSNDNDNNNNNKSKANENTRHSSVVNSIREWANSINVLNPTNFYLFGLLDKTTTTETTTATTTTKTKTLSIVEISNMRVRDIKRRLAREHGYGADEIAKMIDKKELINALSYEEHRVYQKEVETKQRMALKKSIMVALVCVILVMFRPLLLHAWEVLVVNLQVYTDKKRYEWSRIYDYRSFRAAWGFFLILCVDGLQLWLTMSVLASWIIPKNDQKWNSYLFPVPYIPIRPAALIASATTAANPYSSPGTKTKPGTASAAGAGPLGHYGINIGPMLISWLFRYGTSKIEMYMGKALSEARRYKKKQEKIKKRGASSLSSSSSSSKRKQQTKKKKSRDIHNGNQKVAATSAEGGAAPAANDEATEVVQDNDNKRKNHTSAIHTTTDTCTHTKAYQKDQQQPHATTENANNDATLNHHVYGAMDELD